MQGIWRAASEGDLGWVERLVGQNSDLLDARNENGETPLILASGSGHLGVVRWLLDHGAAIDGQNGHGDTALWDACFYGRPQVVRLLVERGADPTIANIDGSIPLGAASRQGDPGVVRLLLDHPSGESTIKHRNKNGMTPLWLACLYGKPRATRLLLERGSDPTIMAHDGTTPMAKAKEAHCWISAEDRKMCVAALQVRFWSFASLSTLC
jgi:uncharacterized protein